MAKLYYITQMDRKTSVDTGDVAEEKLAWKCGESKESAPKAINITVMGQCLPQQGSREEEKILKQQRAPAPQEDQLQQSPHACQTRSKEQASQTPRHIWPHSVI